MFISDTAPKYEEVRYVDYTLVRHGETFWNEKKPIPLPSGEVLQGPLIQGVSNTPLNENGRKQAAETAKKISSLISYRKMVASPLDRALETATIISKESEITPQVDPSFAACSWGVCEGRPKEYRVENYHFDIQGNFRGEGWEKMTTEDRWKHQPIPGGDAAWSVMTRMKDSLEKLAGESVPGEEVLVVTHQENMKCFMLYCFRDVIEKARKEGNLETINSWETREFKNCSLHRFRYHLDTRDFTYLGEVVAQEKPKIEAPLQKKASGKKTVFASAALLGAYILASIFSR